MNSSDSNTPSTPGDDGFDARARRAHAAAQDALSPRVRAQLQQRRRAALAGPRAAHGMRWVPTLAMAATLALAAALGLRLWPQTAADGDAGTVTAPAVAGENTDDASTDSATPVIAGTASPPGGTATASVPPTGAEASAGPGATADAGLAASLGDVPTSPAGSRSVDAGLDSDLDAIAALLAAAGDDDADDVIGADIVRDDALLAALEESPDFYLWLGADDGAGVEAL